MADNTTGVTISQLTQTTTLMKTDRIEIDRNGSSYSISYGTMLLELKESLGINELIDGLTNIIG